MIIYVETNFIFELGLGRAQQESCRTILNWCEAGRIEFRLPAFAIPETQSALRRRESTRFDLVGRLRSQQKDARRHSADPMLYKSAEAGDTARRFFVSGDADFAGARQWLHPYSCDLLTSYSAAVARLKAQLE